MNEFTKEELREIYGCVNSIVAINAQSKAYYSPLANKIQSMIDNYCEHEPYETSALINYCYKCDKSEFVSL